MTVAERKIKDLIPYAKNSRTHSEDQIKQVMRSIEEFGFTNPVLLHKNTILAGHCRVEAAKRLGRDKVPCVNLDHLTPDQARAYVIADNKLAMNAGWDDAVLRQEIEDLLKTDFDISIIGFDASEFKDLGVEDFKAEPLGDPDSIPEVPQNIHNVQRGEIWQLGEHRLMCGDSTDAVDVARLMGGQKADMVFTDPPYKVETEGGFKGEIGGVSAKKGLQKLAESIDFISEFDPEAFLPVMRSVFTKNNMNAYVFCNKDLLPEYLLWARSAGFSFNVLIWKKPCAIPIGDSHRPDIEYLLLFRKSAIWNNGLKDVNYSRCLEYSRESGLHPTMKPVALLENELLISSNNGSIVVDFFGGSGSTLIACEKTGRKCFGMELDEHYCSVIIERWQQFTGKKAERLDAA
jgi:DNA modification methylase